MNYPTVITAMVTPFTADLKIDFIAVEKLVRHLIKTGSDGILVCGTTGESPTLTRKEKLDLLRCVQETAQQTVPVIMGVGGNCTTETLDFLAEVTLYGPDMILSVAPYYNKPSQEGIFEHFSALAKASKFPIILYNIPSRTGINMTSATIAKLATAHKNIVALKQSAPDMDFITALKQVCPADFIIYSGDDSLTLPMLSLGAKGVVSVASHIAGNQIQQMINLFMQGKVQSSLDIHQRLFPLFKGLFIAPNPTPVKNALMLRDIISTDTVRLPLVPVNATLSEEIKNILAQCVV